MHLTPLQGSYQQSDESTLHSVYREPRQNSREVLAEARILNPASPVLQGRKLIAIVAVHKLEYSSLPV